MITLLIGIDYFADRGSGDKNFWLQLLPVLTKNNSRIIVISFNYRKIKQENQNLNIDIINIRPFHFGIDIKKDIANIENEEKCHNHFRKQPTSIIERSLSIVLNIIKIKSIVKKHNITNIHFMDNFGPIMGLLNFFLPNNKISVTAIGFLARNKFHEKYLFASFKHLNSIIASTDAYKQKLIDCNINSTALNTIHWGIDFSKIKPRNTNINNNRIILWTGFIQQVREKSFFTSLEIAKEVIKKCKNLSFVFAFKPECFKDEYNNFNSNNIIIKSTNQMEFTKILNDVVLLLSPVINQRSIVSPPLTWIECMAREIPVFTTDVLGVDEIINHEKNGYINESPSNLAKGIITSIKTKSYLKMGQNAKSFVNKNFNIENIAKQYIKLWSENE